jgi:hypothetical protein
VYMRDNMQYLSFWAWFILLTWFQFHSFSCKSSILYDSVLQFVYIPHFLYSFVHGHLGWFYTLAIVNTAAISMGGKLSLLYADLHTFGYVPKSGITGPYGSSIFRFLKKLHFDFHSGSTNLHSHQQLYKNSFFPLTSSSCICCFLACHSDWCEWNPMSY